MPLTEETFHVFIFQTNDTIQKKNRGDTHNKEKEKEGIAKNTTTEC